jgi:hypothetical protein
MSAFYSNNKTFHINFLRYIISGENIQTKEQEQKTNTYFVWQQTKKAHTKEKK